jgi:hypothetical protein
MKQASEWKNHPMRFNFKDTFTLNEIRASRKALFSSWNESIAAFILLRHFVNGEDESEPTGNITVGLLGEYIYYNNFRFFISRSGSIEYGFAVDNSTGQGGYLMLSAQMVATFKVAEAAGNGILGLSRMSLMVTLSTTSSHVWKGCCFVVIPMQ